MNEKQTLQKIFSKINQAIQQRRPVRYFIFCIILAFLAGCLCAGLFIAGQRSALAGKFDSRYHSQHGRATEIIGRLENELERERDINRRLREHNTRARELADGITGAAERNVRNLQDAVSLIGEIRTKVKVLADFYNGSTPGHSSD
ncbi:MAG: hypothetical protein FWD26_05205 [Treponema sp.]|nr:hypothetical protein [Treponema sp.]